MRQNISIILIFVSLFSFFIGCVDDDDPVPTIEERYHLSKIYKNDLLIARFIYSNYRLDTIVQYTRKDSAIFSDSSVISITYRGDYIDRYHYVQTKVEDKALTKLLGRQIDSMKYIISLEENKLSFVKDSLNTLLNDSAYYYNQYNSILDETAQSEIDALVSDSLAYLDTLNIIQLKSLDQLSHEDTLFIERFPTAINDIGDQILTVRIKKYNDSISLYNDFSEFEDEINVEINTLEKSEIAVYIKSLEEELSSLEVEKESNVAETTSYLIEVFYHDDYPDLIHYLDYRKFMTDSTNNSYLLTQYRVSYQYNEAKKITEEYRYQVNDNSVEPVEFDQIAYDSEGNINSKERYRIDPGRNVDQLTNIFSYLHDDNVNPFRFLHVLPDSLLVFQGYNMLSQNNIKELRKKDELGNPLPKESYYSNITYNTRNYPAIEERYSFDPLAEKEVFKYEYLGSPEIIAY